MKIGLKSPKFIANHNLTKKTQTDYLTSYSKRFLYLQTCFNYTEKLI